MGHDTSGELAIYVRVVLADWAVRQGLAEITAGITHIFFEELRPRETWESRLYFRFRGESEQAKRNDPDWA